MTGITLQDGVSEINKYFQKYCRPSKVRNASLISQHSVMIKADPSDIKDDSSCDKALRHLKQLVQDMTCIFTVLRSSCWNCGKSQAILPSLQK